MYKNNELSDIVSREIVENLGAGLLRRQSVVEM